jgi:hypothetical protein
VVCRVADAGAEVTRAAVDVWQLAGQAITAGFMAGAVYGAIRADLKNLYYRAEANERRVEQAHARIDKLLEGHA